MTKRYEKYKDSGITWIGEIPDGWEVKKLKFLTKFRNGFAHENDINDNGEFIVVNSKFVSTDGEIKKYCDTLIQPLYKGDICIVMSDVPNGRAYAKCFVVNENLKYSLNQRVGAFYNYTLNRNYFYYFINRNKELMFYDDGFNQTNLRKPDLMSISVAYPNIPEQEQIAKYLDWKCGEVDRIVDVRERQIKLLGELRTSVISRAVTRGLDPNAPLKNSGIEWIGEIPEHWERYRFKNFINLINKPSININKIGLENIESGTGKFLASDSEFEGNGVEFIIGDLVYGKLRPYLKKVWLSDCCGNAVGDFFVFRVNENATNQYIKYLLLSDVFTSVADGATYGAKMPRVSSDFILNLHYYISTIEEQQQIAEYLDKKTAEIDSAIEKFKAQIDKIKEYRQALITEVVTGKIDVRGVEIPAPKSN